MKTAILQNGQKSDWDAFVYSHGDATAWHIYDWGKLVGSHYRVTYYPIAVYDGPEVCGILPLYQVRTWRTGTKLISIPYMVAGGIVARDHECQHLLLERAIELSRELGSVPIVLKQYKNKIDGPLETDDGYYNLELPLTDDIAVLWNGLDEENRVQVEQSRRQDVQVEYPYREFDTFYRSLLKNQRVSGIPCPTRRWIKLLLNSGIYEMAVLRLQGHIAVAALVKKFKKSLSFPLSSLPQGEELGGPLAYRLYWDIIAQTAKDGFDVYYSGRIRGSEPVASFRTGWGGEQCRYYYQTFGRPAGQASVSSRKGRMRKLFEAVWRRSPMPLTRLIGPSLIRQYP